MRLLVLDAALSRCSAAVVGNGRILASRSEPGGRGHSAALAPMVAAVLDEARIPAADLDGVAVTVGPGSFTGLRTALALAHGVAAAAGLRVAGVTVAEALADAVGALCGRGLWVAIDSRRGRVFLHRDGAIGPAALDALPPAPGPVAIAGDAAAEVAGRLAARGDDVILTQEQFPEMAHVAAVAARRLAGTLPWLEAQPLYVDPPEAKLPAGGLRPPPRPVG